jgi:retron-type reverse transcriptase
MGAGVRFPRGGSSSRSPAAGGFAAVDPGGPRPHRAIEPIFEADMLECSFGFRPRRSAHDALQVLVDAAWSGRRWVVETDIANCFEAIPHDRLMAAIEERIVDRKVLKLLRAMLRAGVMETRRSRAAKR